MTSPDDAPPRPTEPVLAYRNPGFLDGPDGRPLRILSEYLYPLSAFRLQRVQDTIVFLGSARITEDGPLGRYYQEARELARRLTEWSKSLPSPNHRYLVCSGGGPGIMEAANRGASEARGRTIGLNIGLPHEQRPNPWITRELSFEFHYFFMRKLWFAYMARAVVAFPGGYGTMDEMFELLTLCQTGKLPRPIPIFLYGPEYWSEILNLDALVKHGTISAADQQMLHVVDSPETALNAIQAAVLREPEGAPGPPAIAPSRTPDATTSGGATR